MPIRDTEDIIYSTSLERARPEACEDGERGTVHRERWRVNRWPLVREGGTVGQIRGLAYIDPFMHVPANSLTIGFYLIDAMGCI
jgi:hypothetical protein